MAVLFCTAENRRLGLGILSPPGRRRRTAYGGEDEETEKEGQAGPAEQPQGQAEGEGPAPARPGVLGPWLTPAAPQRRQGFCWARARMSCGSPWSGSMPFGEIGGPSAAWACRFRKSPLMLTGMSMAKKLVEAATD